MSKMKIALIATTLAIIPAGCSKPAADNVAAVNTVDENAMAAGTALTDNGMVAANGEATDNAMVAENAANMMNTADEEDKTSSGGVVLKN